MIYGFTFYVLIIVYFTPNATGYVVEPNPQTFMTWRACEDKADERKIEKHQTPYSMECQSVVLPVAVP